MYTIILLIALFIITGLLMLIHHLAIDPGFGIKTRAAGDLSLYLAYPFRRATIVYGDIDCLGKINDALTSPGVYGHDRFNVVLRGVLRQLRGTDKALVYGGDELRLLIPTGLRGGRRANDNARMFCDRFQALLKDAPLLNEERARLFHATGYDHIRITLAYAPDARYTERRMMLGRAKRIVGCAKPKGEVGRRGQIFSINS